VESGGVAETAGPLASAREKSLASPKREREGGPVAGRINGIPRSRFGLLLTACVEMKLTIFSRSQLFIQAGHYLLALFPSFPSIRRFSCPAQARVEQKETKETKSENRFHNGGKAIPGVNGIVSTTTGGF
jgi:hypothetical protein